MHIQMTKPELRELFKIRAQGFFAHHNTTQLVAIHKQITERLTTYCTREFSVEERSNVSVAVYKPMRAELPVTEIVSASAAFINPTFVYPHLEGDAMWFVSEGAEPRNPDFVIVPGLFVDSAGNRLGRGRGCYDRFLRETEISLNRRIFLGYDFQFVVAIPTDERDERVTILSERP